MQPPPETRGHLQFVLPENAAPRRLHLSTATTTVEAGYCGVLPSAPALSRRDQRGTGRITYFYLLTGTVLQVSCVLTLRFHRACHPVSAPGIILLPLVQVRLPDWADGGDSSHVEAGG